jgi:hypothetical protein
MRLCACGCGSVVESHGVGRPRRYVNRQHYIASVASLKRDRYRPLVLPGDLPPAVIEQVITQARAQVRYARIMETER